MPLDLGPIIHSGPPEFAIVHPESQGLDQVQDGVGRGAEAGDVAGIRRDFRFEQHHVHVQASVG